MILTFVSLLLVVISILAARLSGLAARHLASICTLALFSCAMLIFYAAAVYFTGDGIDDSVLYHIRFGLSGAGFGQYLALIAAIALSAVASAAVVIGGSTWKRRRGKPSTRMSYLAYLSAALSLGTNPTTQDIAETWGNFQDEIAPFESYYREPKIKATGRRPKNLILIYADGLEYTYFDESRFPNLITELRLLQKEGITYTNITQTVGANFTLAGMVASQCGVPLFTTSHGNSMSGVDHFLPGAKGLGELLPGVGYNLTYMGALLSDSREKASFTKPVSSTKC